MQLKLCLLIAFVLNVSCVNVENDPSADVAPMRMNSSVKSPKNDLSSFVELFSSANPDVINQVIGLLETELSEADSTLSTLTDRVDETLNNFFVASNELTVAQDTLIPQIQGLQDTLKAAEDKHDNALEARDIAQHDYNEQSPELKEEKRALQEAIEKLRPLQDAQEVGVGICMNHDQDYASIPTPAGIENWAVHGGLGYRACDNLTLSQCTDLCANLADCTHFSHSVGGCCFPFKNSNDCQNSNNDPGWLQRYKHYNMKGN